MMRQRQKQQPGLYPKWRKKRESPAKLAKMRDSNVCVDCKIPNRTLMENENGQYILYLHTAHCHPLDPDPVEPIDGQRLRARCPSCHGWRNRAEVVKHQRRLHGIPIDRFFLHRFLVRQ